MTYNDDNDKLFSSTDSTLFDLGIFKNNYK